jgi:hypothetical protein
VFPLAMLPDVAAADAAATGTTRTGVFTGVWTAGETIGLALGPGLYALALQLGGYAAGAADQTPAARTAIVAGFALVPGGAGRGQPARAAPLHPRRTERRCPAEQEIVARLEALRAGRPARPTAGAPWPTSTTRAWPEADAVGLRALAMFASTNGLDPTAFPSLAAMERDLVAFARPCSAPARRRRRHRHLRRHRVDPAGRADRPGRGRRRRAGAGRADHGARGVPQGGALLRAWSSSPSTSTR